MPKYKSLRRQGIIAEPLEDRLLFSATTDFVLLDEGVSDAHDLNAQADNTNLLDVLQIPELPQLEDNLLITDADETNRPPRAEFDGELIFVDSGIDNAEKLITDLQLDSDSKFEIFVLDGDKEGIEQISLVLAQYSGVQAIHLLSHGNQGRISLGESQLDLNSIDGYEDQLASWSEALDGEADILIYGCNLAANDSGLQLVNQIAQITQADVAASNDQTGAQGQGGDWDLESVKGEIETSALSAPSWNGLLAAIPADDTITVWHDETVTGNLFTGIGGSGIQADTFSGSGQLVSVEYNSVVYSSFDGDNNITIAADDGTFVINQDGTYTYSTSYSALTVSRATLPDWSGAFNLYGYEVGTAYASGSVLDTSWSSATTVFEDYYGLGKSGAGSVYNGIDASGGNTEAVVIDTQGSYQLFTVTTGGLSSSESAQWQAYDASGNLVSSGTFSGDGGNSDSEESVDTFTTGSAFQYLVFTSVNDGDNYLVSEITLADPVPSNEVFTYTVADTGDGGAADGTGTFTISYVDDNNHGVAWYSGAITEGETVNVGFSTDDPDGRSGALTYQWQRSADGANWQDISGETSVNHVLTSDDGGMYIRAELVFTDDEGTMERLASAVSSVRAISSDGTGSAVITGTQWEGETLTGTVYDQNGATGTIDYQWQRSADGATGWSDISGAISNTYTLTGADVNQYVRVTADYTDDASNPENIQSLSSEQITSTNNSGSISFSGTATEDQTLTASVTDLDGASGTITYRWEHSADGSSGWSTVQNTTANSYTLTDSEVNGYVRVTANYTDDQGFTESPTSSNSAQIESSNEVPIVLTPIGNQMADEDSIFNYQIPTNTFFDANGDTLSLTVELINGGALPAWLTFDSATNTLSGTPINTDVGLITLVVFAEDPSGTRASTTFDLQINAVNDSPIVTGISDHTVLEDAADEIVELSNHFFDEEESTNLRYSLVDNSNAAIFNTVEVNEFTGVLLLNYAQNQYGSSVLQVQATDSEGAFVVASFLVTIVPVNDVPVAEGIDDLVVVSGIQNNTNIDLSSAFFDVEDGANLTYSVVDNTNPDVMQVVAVDSVNQQLVLEFTSMATGEGTVTIAAVDSNGAVVESSFNVSVLPSPVDNLPVTPAPQEPDVSDESPQSTPNNPDDSANDSVDESPNNVANDAVPDDVDIPRSDRQNGGGLNDFIVFTNNLGDTTLNIGYDARVDFNTHSVQKLREAHQSSQLNTTLNDGLASLVSIPGSYLSEQDIADFNVELKKLKADMDTTLEEEKTSNALYKGITISFTTGLVIWLLRAGSFFLTLFSLLPVWKGLDPLPVVTNQQRREESKRQREDKQIEDEQSKEVGYLFDSSENKPR